MSTLTASATGHSRQAGRSVIAIAAALVANVVLSVGTDQILHVLGIYPPWGQPMYDTSLNALALGYRIVFGIASGYLVARLAPHTPMRHATILGIIAVVLSTLGAVAAITQADLGPAWYPILLVIVAYPCVWLGAVLHRRRHGIMPAR
ncbi:MAG TPA: hypothetical protein VM076_13005 [Gemmatimonadaceae bacterium]|nr:hypothetical protein [Gemmatimonadaceae bacterium]